MSCFGGLSFHVTNTVFFLKGWTCGLELAGDGGVSVIGRCICAISRLFDNRLGEFLLPDGLAILCF